MTKPVSLSLTLGVRASMSLGRYYHDHHQDDDEDSSRVHQMGHQGHMASHASVVQQHHHRDNGDEEEDKDDADCRPLAASGRVHNDKMRMNCCW